MSLLLSHLYLGQVWYLIVSIPDLCSLTYFLGKTDFSDTFTDRRLVGRLFYHAENQNVDSIDLGLGLNCLHTIGTRKEQIRMFVLLKIGGTKQIGYSFCCGLCSLKEATELLSSFPNPHGGSFSVVMNNNEGNR